MLKTKVILSRVTNLSDARYASGMGVDYIGFSIDPENPRYVTVEEAKTISDWLSGVSIISEIGTSIPSEIQDYSAANIQTSNVSLIDKLAEPILAANINTENINQEIDLLTKHSNQVNFFILNVEAKQLSTLQPHLSEACRNHQVYIATEFNSSNLDFVLNHIIPAGIVLYGSEEVQPGLSSYDGIADILELLEED